MRIQIYPTSGREIYNLSKWSSILKNFIAKFLIQSFRLIGKSKLNLYQNLNASGQKSDAISTKRVNLLYKIL